MSDDSETKKAASCPVHNEYARHLLYVGGMVALHTGLGATMAGKGSSSKCPVSEWGRHAVYVGGFVALAVKAGLAAQHTAKPAIKGEEADEDKHCPVNELYRHAIYVAGMIGVVALINSRKK